MSQICSRDTLDAVPDSKIRLARALVRSSARDGITESERIRAIAALPLPEDRQRRSRASSGSRA